MRPAVHAGAHSPLSPHPSAWYPYRFWIVSFAFAGMIESLTFVSAVTIVGAATRATGTTAGRSAGAIESASVVVESASILFVSELRGAGGLSEKGVTGCEGHGTRRRAKLARRDKFLHHRGRCGGDPFGVKNARASRMVGAQDRGRYSNLRLRLTRRSCSRAKCVLSRG